MHVMSLFNRLVFASLILVHATANAQSVTGEIAAGDSLHAATGSSVA